jgi:hypothetical protein
MTRVTGLDSMTNASAAAITVVALAIERMELAVALVGAVVIVRDWYGLCIGARSMTRVTGLDWMANASAAAITAVAPVEATIWASV